MFTVKCQKASGVMHVYEATGYTIIPPAKNSSGEIVTTVESWQPGQPILHHVCRDSDLYYREIFIENASGKTIDVIRSSNVINKEG